MEVLVSLRNDYRTHSSKLIDKNFHIGRWVIKIFEIGKVEDGLKKEIFKQAFCLVTDTTTTTEESTVIEGESTDIISVNCIPASKEDE